MEPKRSDRILDEWSSVARSATPPGAPAVASTGRTSGSGVSLAGGALLVVAAIAVFAMFGNRAGPSGPGAPAPTPTPTPAPSIAVAIPQPCPTPPPVGTPEPCPTPSPSPSQTPSASPASSPSLAACEGSSLAASITSWDGAAGSRIATVVLSNPGSAPCTTSTLARVRLVDGGGTELIQGKQPSRGTTITIPAGSSVTTLVQVSNYCGAPPVAPVGIAFDINGVATVLAKPASNTDATVPPCNGPGQPATIEMHPWSAS